jgi:hypothetical protein
MIQANSISSFNHSRLCKFVRSSLLGQNHPNEKCSEAEQPLRVRRVFLDQKVQDLNEHFQVWITELAFNLSKVGISDWEDRKTRKVVISPTIGRRSVRRGISRKLKHISAITCISAAGKSFISYIIVLQDSLSVRERLRRHAVRFGTDSVMKSNENAYISAEIFINYMWTVLLPNLVELGALNTFADAIAMLLMDNCSSHIGLEAIGLLTKSRLCLIIFASHTTQIFQVPDLTLFGILKQAPRYELLLGDEKATVRVITRVYHNFKGTKVESSIKRAF